MATKRNRNHDTSYVPLSSVDGQPRMRRDSLAAVRARLMTGAVVEFHGFEGGKPTLHRVEATAEELAAGIEVPAYTQRVTVVLR